MKDQSEANGNVLVSCKEISVPRYYFHLRDGISPLDRIGTHLPDEQHARRLAINTAGAMLKDVKSVEVLDGPWGLIVEDEQGRVIFNLSVLTSLSGYIARQHE